MSKVRVVSLEAENLRGYSYTSLRIDRLIVLIGENNQGKSSMLKMFDRLLNVNDIDWTSDRVLSEEGYKFWYPANTENHKARRFTVAVRIIDGRIARRFKCTANSILTLRFAVRSVDGECRLNIGVPRRAEVHDPKAVELLELLKNSIRLLLLPPLRDAQSSSFADKATRSVRERVEKKLLHRRQAGAPKEYRLAKEVVEQLKKIVSYNKEEVRGADGSPLAGMMLSNEVRLDIEPIDVLRLLEGSLHLYVSTGAHDESMVQPHETGNGLQSLIDMDLSLSHSAVSRDDKEIIAIIEEPEAFLHPSAQRQFMQYLRDAIGKKVSRVILTTHSPIIVDESRFEEVAIVRMQRHFQPKVVDNTRASINTALMSVANSEVFFARTVLLVEGEGDRALLSTILRRIAAKCGVDRELSGIVIQPTGSCKSYSPWIRLLDSFRHGDNAAFELVWLMDGDAASVGTDRAALRCCRESGRGIGDAGRDALIAFGDIDWSAATRMPSAVDAANRFLERAGGALFCCDLEWAIFNQSDRMVIDSVRRALERCDIGTDGSPIDLARRLGSKIETGISGGAIGKKPFVRAAIGESLPLKRLPPEIEAVIRRVLLVATGRQKRVDEIMKKAAG